MSPVIPPTTKRGAIAFTGTVADFRQFLWMWIQIDSRTSMSTWDYIPKQRMWRRTTNRGER